LNAELDRLISRASKPTAKDNARSSMPKHIVAFIDTAADMPPGPAKLFPSI
jgi:hypothetical protein